MTDYDALVSFLRARLDEAASNVDEVHNIDCDVAINRHHGECDCGHPARVLRAVAAKRRILEEHPEVTVSHEDLMGGHRVEVPEWACGRCVDPTNGRKGVDIGGDRWREESPCTTLRLLALPYADHPDYRKEWAA